jgi:hypothetical protein
MASPVGLSNKQPTMEQKQIQQPSSAFIGASWAALLIGVAGFLIGLGNADMALNEKGYYAEPFCCDRGAEEHQGSQSDRETRGATASGINKASDQNRRAEIIPLSQNSRKQRFQPFPLFTG